MPVSWRGTLVQYAGRLHRAHQGKSEVRIYDYVDREVPMLARMFEKRLKGYRAMGYDAVVPLTGRPGAPGSASRSPAVRGCVADERLRRRSVLIL
jgi:superfamily II DNA or RNA helicase